MVILGSFFVMNLILGVLSGEFSKVTIVFLYPAADATVSLAPTPVSNSVLSPSLTLSDFHSDSVSGWFCLPETKYVRTICLRTKCLPDETSIRTKRNNDHRMLHTGCFFNWYPPKKLKYGKPRLGESTAT